ncbi:Bet v 1 domain-containing protein [Abeliophyllum distichum]|uniref:Bet v 1 domain-containing protein n=1 Tax=Abeliophyllum distichum TaxID=126358 RepID=A0ABD1Q079_9LAMI
MGVFKFFHEIKTKVAPQKMFKILVTESSKVLPKATPSIKSVEIIEGDGGVGSIWLTTFPEGAHFKYVKHRINLLDTVNHVCKYTLIEGEVLGDKLESIVYEVKFEHTEDGGCVVKETSEYHTKGDFELKEEDVKAGKEQAKGLYKACEEYLIANPHVFA